jgi:hypothetical protein
VAIPRVPIYVTIVNQLIMGSHGTPTVPLLIGQGAHGELEGTAGDKPGVGEGDRVMIAGDVRSLAREYCARGVTVQYIQYDKPHHRRARVASRGRGVARRPVRWQAGAAELRADRPA